MSDFSRSPLSPRGEPEPRLRDSGAEQDGSVTEPPHPPATEVTARDGHQGPPGTEQDDPAGEAEISLPSKGEVATPFDLVGYGYQRNGQRLGALRKSTIDGLSKAESPSPGELEQVRRMSRRDAGRLAVPVQVLHAVLQQDIRGKAEHDVLRLLGAAIRSHPIFDDDAVRGVLELAPDAGLSRAIERICGLDDDVINASAPDVELTPKSIVELRTNAVYTLILFVAVRDKLAPSDVAPHLYTHLWKSQARADELDKHPLVGLTTAIPSGHLANAVDVWVAEVALARDRVAEAHSAQRAAEARSQRLQSETETREGRLRDADAKIEMLEQHRSEVEQELARERKVRADGQAHASADYEQLRAKSVKRMKKQSELLEEGLHALRREPPVVEVGLDRMERTLDRLHADLQDLRGKDRQ